MKAKLLLMLFLVSLSLGVFASEHHQKKPHAVCKVYEKVATRIPRSEERRVGKECRYRW